MKSYDAQDDILVIEGLMFTTVCGEYQYENLQAGTYGEYWYKNLQARTYSEYCTKICRQGPMVSTIQDPQ